MSEWDTREAAFEKRQEVDSALEFKARARRNKLVGLWAAEQLGLPQDEAEAYAKRLVEARITEDDDASLAAWLGEQLKGVTPPVTSYRIAIKLGELTAQARSDIFAGR